MNDLAVRESLPAVADADLIKQIADDIGKEVAHHIEIMYPDAVTATSRSMLISVRGCVYNEIMAAIQVNDAGEIVARLKHRKAFRRTIKAIYTKVRKARSHE